MAETTTVQRHLPRRPDGRPLTVTIGGERFHLTAGGERDGAPTEVLLQRDGGGAAGAGPMDVYATALSLGLRHGVPLADLVAHGVDLAFAPSGDTDDPEIPQVRSVVDWVARRLALDWLAYEERARLGIFTVDERVEKAADWRTIEDAERPTGSADQGR